jgi:hypothetical protein
MENENELQQQGTPVVKLGEWMLTYLLAALTALPERETLPPAEAEREIAAAAILTKIWTTRQPSGTRRTL